MKRQSGRDDMIAKLAASNIAKMLKNIFVEMMEVPYIKKMLISTIKERKDWRTLIIQYLMDNTLLFCLKEAKMVARLSNKYAISLNDELYKRSFSQPLLKCLGLEDTQYALREVHKGICGVHTRAKALTKQAIRVGFF